LHKKSTDIPPPHYLHTACSTLNLTITTTTIPTIQKTEKSEGQKTNSFKVRKNQKNQETSASPKTEWFLHYTYSHRKLDNVTTITPNIESANTPKQESVHSAENEKTNK
jgi:hypothetical protein